MNVRRAHGRWITPCAVVLIFAQWGSVPAEAGSAPGHHHESLASGDGALDRDAQWYADEFAIPVDEALSRVQIFPELDRLIAAARDAAGSRWAGGWIQHQPDFAVVVQVTGPDRDLDEIHELLRDAPAPGRLLTEAPHSIAALEAAHDRILPDLGERWPEAASGVNIMKSRIEISGPVLIDQSDLATLAEAAGVPVTFELAPAMTPMHTYGGKLLTSNGQPECTAGFTVRNLSTGVEGVTTAGHCANTLTYWQDGSTSYALTFMGVRHDADQDLQWHKETAHAVYPQFWDGFALRSAEALVARADMPNDAVCHYGITTGKSCGTVTTIHLDPGDICGPSESDPCDATWVEVEGGALACFFGDSGGPVFFGTNVYGSLVFGAFSGPDEGDCVSMAFMSVGFFTSGGMNLEVLLDN